MLKKLSCLFVFVFSLSANGQTTINDLMPKPQTVEIGVGKFRVTSSFKVKVVGNPASRINVGVSGMVKRLGGRTGFFLPQVFFSKEDTISDADLTISISRPGIVKFGEDESYKLLIDKGKIRLEAETDIGALHGLETFLQLLESDNEGYFVPAVKIKDYPRFPWRGLLIDVCRHFQPVEVIKRNLDGMASAKMNVFHWHLSENQGFRAECKTFPKLHELGSDGQYYTQEEIKSIIKYADDRGIRVIPEFDLPGHATSWFVGYPEFASMPETYETEKSFGIFDPTFNVTLEKTYTFLDAFYKEMSQLFTDEYMHIGGDENNGVQWEANEQIQVFMKENNIKDNGGLQSYFNNRLLKILTKLDKKMIGWDEILQPEMPKDIVIQSWRGKESMELAAKGGYQTILSNGYYIDLTQTTEFHYLNDPVPPDIELTEEQKKLILGGEATMWGEIIDHETIDSRIWPRTAAIAERLWSPVNTNNVEDMYRRIKTFSFRLEELGLTHEKNIPYLLRRLTNNAPIEELRILIDVIEPVKEYKRDEIRPHYTYSIMSRVVDAARPDAEVARNFRNHVANYLKANAGDRKRADEILYWLKIWGKNHSGLVEIIKASPILWEIESLSEDLSACGKIGVQAMDMIINKKSPSQDWLEKSWHTLYMAKAPRGENELMIISAIEDMIDYLAPEFSNSKGDNTLSGKEIAEGWHLLFDGITTKNWRAYGQENFPEAWGVSNGMLYSMGTDNGIAGDGYDILSVKEYSYFELSLDWKIAKGGNSGIFYMCKENAGLPIYKSNLQMQLLDNENNEDALKGKNGNRKAGALWDLIPANPQNTKPAGEWNTVKIIVRSNGQILHIQNGKTVVEYYPGKSWYKEWDKLLAVSAFKDVEHLKNPQRKGFIGLQEHGGGVWFKNIKIRELKYD